MTQNDHAKSLENIATRLGALLAQSHGGRPGSWEAMAWPILYGIYEEIRGVVPGTVLGLDGIRRLGTAVDTADCPSNECQIRRMCTRPGSVGCQRPDHKTATPEPRNYVEETVIYRGSGTDMATDLRAIMPRGKLHDMVDSLVHSGHVKTTPVDTLATFDAKVSDYYPDGKPPRTPPPPDYATLGKAPKSTADAVRRIDAQLMAQHRAFEEASARRAASLPLGVKAEPVGLIDNRIPLPTGPSACFKDAKTSTTIEVAEQTTAGGPIAPPVPRSAEQLQRIIAEKISGILGSNITSEAMDRRAARSGWYQMRYDDIIADLNLWERLGTAQEALGALKGYSGTARGFVMTPEQVAKGKANFERLCREHGFWEDGAPVPPAGPWCENCGDAFTGPERDCPKPAKGRPYKECGRGGHMFRLEHDPAKGSKPAEPLPPDNLRLLVAQRMLTLADHLTKAHDHEGACACVEAYRTLVVIPCPLPGAL
jgi:hypothetical protein